MLTSVSFYTFILNATNFKVMSTNIRHTYSNTQILVSVRAKMWGNVSRTYIPVC